MSTRKIYTDIESFLIDLPEITGKAASSLRGQNAEFMLKTKSGKAWEIHLKDGLFSISDNLQPNQMYDCTAIVDDNTLLDIINGRTNAVKAMMFRKIRTEGDVSKLIPLLKLL